MGSTALGMSATCEPEPAGARQSRGGPWCAQGRERLDPGPDL